jgi:hypothetical protein
VNPAVSLLDGFRRAAFAVAENGLFALSGTLEVAHAGVRAGAGGRR